MSVQSARADLLSMYRSPRKTSAPEPLAYDYDLQVWTRGGIVQCCQHPASMRTERVCCNQFRYEGMTIETARRLDVDSRKGGR